MLHVDAVKPPTVVYGILQDIDDGLLESNDLCLQLILGNHVSDGEFPTESFVSVFEFPADKGTRLLERSADLVRLLLLLQRPVLFLGLFLRLFDLLLELLDLFVLGRVAVVLLAALLDAVPEADRRGECADEGGTQHGYDVGFLVQTLAGGQR